jgi:hypothetical protein
MATQTLGVLPVADANFIPALQAFLRTEDAERFKLQFAPFVQAGGLHGPAASLTGTPTALVAFPGGYYVTETGSITYPDATVYVWVIVHKDTDSDVTSFTRVFGTHYLIQSAAVQPVLPLDCLWLMRVTTAGGAITAIMDLRIVTPLGTGSPASGFFSDAEGDPAVVALTSVDGTSAYAARRDHVHAAAETTAVTLTNRTGATAVIGDVVTLGASNDSAAVTGDVQGGYKPLVVALAATANLTAGRYAQSGRATVKVTGAVTRGRYLRKSATALTAEDTGVLLSDTVIPPPGTFAVALTADAGGLVTAYLFGFTTASATDLVTLTNRTGAAVAIGDVVTLDTGNDISTALGDAQASLQTFVVAVQALANTVAGAWARSGVVTVKVAAAVTRGDYLRKSATTLAAESTLISMTGTNAVPQGALGVALTSVGGAGTVTALWWGHTASRQDTGELRGLLIANNAGTPASKVDVVADAVDIGGHRAAIVNVTADLTVAGANGLDTGAEAASTWYAVWLIHNPTTDTIASLLSVSFTAPTMPAGYTRKRLVGAARNDAGLNFLRFTQVGEWAYFDDAQSATTTLNASYTDLVLSAFLPTISRVAALLVRHLAGGATASVFVKKKGAANDYWQHKAANTTEESDGVVIVPTDSAQTIQYHTTADSSTVSLAVLGYHVAL